jgi:hypothetical protein
MYNAALALHAIYSTWRDELLSDTITAAQARSDNPLEVTFDAELHWKAMGHLTTLRKQLADLADEGVDVQIYRRYTSSWTARLFNFPYTWQTSTLDAESAFPLAELDMLHTLGMITGMRAPTVDAASLLNLKSVAARVIDLVDEDDTLSPALSQYLNSLAREIGAALDDEQYLAIFDVSAAAQRLWVGLQAAAGQSTDDDKKAKWTETARNIIINASAGALGSAPGVIVQALTAGPGAGA